MSKPVIEGDNVTVSKEWIYQLIRVVDIQSYSCGGISVFRDGEKTLEALADKVISMNADELKKMAR